jgi:hypothetical protein
MVSLQLYQKPSQSPRKSEMVFRDIEGEIGQVRRRRDQRRCSAGRGRQAKERQGPHQQPPALVIATSVPELSLLRDPARDAFCNLTGNIRPGAIDKSFHIKNM